MEREQTPDFFRRHRFKLLGTVAVLAASALYQGTGANPEQTALEEFTGQRPVAAAVTEPALEPRTLKVYRGFEDPNYAIWDAEIIDSVDFWNKEYEKYRELPNWGLLEPELYKCLCLYECRENPRAFRHNPPQFGNKGDPGFIIMRDGGEHGIPEGGYEELHGYKPIPPRFKLVKTKKGKKRVFAGWDFEAEGIIPPELCLKYAAGWLMHKNCIWEETIVEEGPIRTYTVEKGNKKLDTLSEIAPHLGTSIETIQKYNHINPDKIYPAQEIRYRETRIEPMVAGFRGLTVPEGAIDRYNGVRKRDKDPGYLNGVLKIYTKPID